MEDLRTASGHFEHLLVGDLRNTLSALDDTWISGEHTVDVRVDLATISTQRTSQGDRSGVRRSPAQGGDVLRRLRDSLESRDNDEVSGLQRLLDPPGSNVDNASIAMGCGRNNPSLGTRVRACRNTHVRQGHREQGGGLSLARRQEHVKFSRSGLWGDLLGEVHQVVSGVTHSRDDDDNVVSRLLRSGDTARHTLN